MLLKIDVDEALELIKQSLENRGIIIDTSQSYFDHEGDGEDNLNYSVMVELELPDIK